MAQYAKPDQDLDDDVDDNFTPWTDQAGGSSLYEAIDDVPTADDTTTYIKIEDNGDDETCLVRLSDVDAPGSAGTYIKYKARSADDSMMEMGPPELKLELLQGSTVKATTTNSSVALGTFTDYSYTISDVSGISDWTDLKLRITMVSNSGMGDYMHVTHAYLETQDAPAEVTNTQSFSLVPGGAMGTSFSLIGDIDVPPKVRI